MKRQVIVHPVLFALFPIGFVYAPNRASFGLEVMVEPIVLSLAAVGLIWLGLRLVAGNTKSAALAISCCWLLLFSYDSLRDAVTNLGSLSELAQIPVASWIKLASVAILMASLIISVRSRNKLEQATYLFNVIGTILVSMPLTAIAVDSYFTPRPSPSVQKLNSLEPDGVRPQMASLPDIYYFVLDGYGRQDQLERVHGFDNSKFLKALEDLGFYIDSRAVTNYPQTLLSIASTLNLDYVQELLGADLTDVKDRVFARRLVRYNRVVGFLRRLGYKIVTVSSPYYEANIVEADVAISDWWRPTRLELALLDMTPVPRILTGLSVDFPYNLHRSRILAALEGVASIPPSSEPKFVYCHMLYAHPPFVFDEDGGPVTPDRPYSWRDGDEYYRQPNTSKEGYRKGYKRQVSFLNGELQKTLAWIVAQSDRRAVIVVQGDHGSGVGTSLKTLEGTDVEERYSILRAYYLPGELPKQICESVSSVNTFRIIFNRYLGASFPLLEDRLYYAPLEYPYNFVPVAFDVSQHRQGPCGEDLSRPEAPMLDVIVR